MQARNGFEVLFTVSFGNNHEQELKKIQDMLVELVKASSYYCLTSIPGIDIVTATKIISYVMDISRFSSSSKLARFCGIAPSERKVAAGRKSMKNQNTEISRYALPYTLLPFPILAGPETERIKTRSPVPTTLKRSLKGKTKKEALTCLSQRLVDIIFAVMRDRSIYNFSKSKIYKTA